MTRKTLLAIGMALALVLSTFGTVLAAPATQEGTTDPIVGTIQSYALGTDATTGDPIVVVDVLLEDGVTVQSVNLTPAEAEALGLVTLDPTTGDPTLVEGLEGTAFSFTPGETCVDDPLTTDVDECAGEEEVTHPVALALADFFGEDAGDIMDAHEDGFGFGLIAQALWMSEKLGGGEACEDDPATEANECACEDDPATEADECAAGGGGTSFQDILDAKKSGDYSGFTLEDGSTPTNWGQFRKAVLEKKNNLGQVMSGHAEPLDDGEECVDDPATETDECAGGDTETLTTSTNGNGHGHGHGYGKGGKKGHKK